MKRLIKISLTAICSIISILGLYAQDAGKAMKELEDRGEVYIKFNQPPVESLKYIGQMMSIDRIDRMKDQLEVYAYLNKTQFNVFQQKNIEFELLTAPSLKADISMCPDPDGVKNWDCYPTYQQYIDLMYSFQTCFPDLCKVYEFGESTNERKLLAVKISDNVTQDEEEPAFFYTSTMHGDETTGYVLMLRLIEYLLTNYATDSRVTDLIINTEIWINPLSNPDGTYYSGNSTVSGATRFNSAGYDLNRNFPTPPFGTHTTLQKETIAMMNFMKTRNFILSANFHGGVEVVNYPWDTWTSWEKKHTDDAWYQQISREYADTVHANSSAYMTYLDNGVTNGGDWYTIDGGRQDYANYYLRGREVTIEISNTKMPDPSQLPMFWDYNYRSMLNYIQRLHTGVYGKITDQFGIPIKANVFLTAYDSFNSDIFSDSLNGMYYRMLPGGNYQLVASKDGYDPAVFDIFIPEDSKTELNIVLNKHPEGIEDIGMLRFVSNPLKNDLKIILEINEPERIEIRLFNLSGQEVSAFTKKGVNGINELNVPVNQLGAGIYLCSIRIGQHRLSQKLIKLPD